MGLNDHPITFIWAIISCGACGLGVAVEIIRVYQEINALQQNPQAIVAYDLNTMPSCSFFIPTTDIPLQPVAYVTTPLWHIWTAFILFLMFLSEFPGNTSLGNRLGWLPIFNTKDFGVWATGALEILIGLGILAIPAALMGNSQEIWLRFITGWILFLIGIIIFITGLLKGAEIRIWRGQYSKPKDEPSKAAKVKDAWQGLQAAIDMMVGMNVNMAIRAKLNGMNDAVNDL